MSIIDLMNFIDFMITCIGVGIAIERYYKHKK